MFANSTNTVNGVFNPYKVVLTAQTPIINGDKVNITFSSDIGFPVTVTCLAIDNIVNVTCEILSGQTILATLNQVANNLVSTGGQMSFLI